MRATCPLGPRVADRYALARGLGRPLALRAMPGGHCVAISGTGSLAAGRSPHLSGLTHNSHRCTMCAPIYGAPLLVGGHL